MSQTHTNTPIHTYTPPPHRYWDPHGALPFFPHNSLSNEDLAPTPVYGFTGRGGVHKIVTQKCVKRRNSTDVPLKLPLRSTSQ
ncbi:hypothetical protein POVWA2_044250 [Plasmodium ovale wallikeri]|uniref:Uncharacterized protein n=1 Tax=Plasmodium ovale wallikeri TaxID=864142 RepID=A0A1A8ZFP1_PLAOA|nr:hypothetical protein POVWA1_045680 [Plasmodium ovale wallikeri]SBT42653.1 hypothetical protein POVWA2_044250 [Plasmodium ovale wallikeri]